MKQAAVVPERDREPEEAREARTLPSGLLPGFNIEQASRLSRSVIRFVVSENDEWAKNRVAGRRP
jgi:hypothetical protein